MEPVHGLTPLRSENQLTCQRIWDWFVAHGFTGKEIPQFSSEQMSYHCEGIIGINENHDGTIQPIGAVMVEEILHYNLSSGDPRTSEDFSPKFLHSILDIIIEAIAAEPEQVRRQFQSELILTLWRIIDRDSAKSSATPRG